MNIKNVDISKNLRNYIELNSLYELHEVKSSDLVFFGHLDEMLRKNPEMHWSKIVSSYRFISFEKQIERIGIKLGKIGNEVSRASVYNYRRGVATPPYNVLLEINNTINTYVIANNIPMIPNAFLKVMVGLIGAADIYSEENNQDYERKIVPFCNSYSYEQNKLINIFEQLSSVDQTKIMERMDYIISTYKDDSNIPTKRIAVLGQTACGNPIEAISIADEFIETNELKANFALSAIGDSMSPLINNGDIILIKQTKELEIGDIGIFQINQTGFSDDEEVTCKMLKSIKDGIMTLMPLNMEYDPIVIDTKKQQVKIIGKYLGRA